MNKILVILAILVVMSTVFVSGCVDSGSTLSNEQEAGEALGDVSNDISGVLDDLSEMDEELSG